MTRVTNLTRALRFRRGTTSLRGATRVGSVIVMSIAALAVIRFSPAHSAPTAPFANLQRLSAGASINAFGMSREVRIRFALPGDVVDFPLEVSGDPIRALLYLGQRARFGDNRFDSPDHGVVVFRACTARLLSSGDPARTRATGDCRADARRDGSVPAAQGWHAQRLSHRHLHRRSDHASRSSRRISRGRRRRTSTCS